MAMLQETPRREGGMSFLRILALAAIVVSVLGVGVLMSTQANWTWGLSRAQTTPRAGDVSNPPIPHDMLERPQTLAEIGLAPPPERTLSAPVGPLRREKQQGKKAMRPRVQVQAQHDDDNDDDDDDDDVKSNDIVENVHKAMSFDDEGLEDDKGLEDAEDTLDDFQGHDMQEHENTPAPSAAPTPVPTKPKGKLRPVLRDLPEGLIDDETTCVSLTYPRSIKGFLNASDSQYLQTLFFRSLHRLPGVYFKLWRHTNATRDDTTMGILDRLQAKVEEYFGPEFLLINDFYSYRDAKFKQFPAKHQDSMFWLGDTHDCAGFNLWILLGHCQYNHSFDVLEYHKNPYIYKNINLSSDPQAQRRVWGHRVRAINRGHVDESKMHITHVPLGIGDALILKQPEVHSTDKDDVDDDQWRLGIGFKVVKRGTVQTDFPATPLSQDDQWRSIKEEPGMPNYDIGDPVVSPFQALHKYWDHLDEEDISTRMKRQSDAQRLVREEDGDEDGDDDGDNLLKRGLRYVRIGRGKGKLDHGHAGQAGRRRYSIPVYSADLQCSSGLPSAAFLRR